MPVYVDADRSDLFAPELLALLRGRPCFHVKRLDPGLLGHIDDALGRGCRLYRDRGWA
jgi:hypothetical protein